MLGASGAQADETENTLCTFYGAVGGSVLEFVLPLTMQDLVLMVRGQKPELVEDLTKQMTATTESSALGEAVKLGEQDLELLGKAAGTQAFVLAMSGGAASADEAKNALKSACLRNGSQRIIDQQRAANQAEEAMQ